VSSTAHLFRSTEPLSLAGSRCPLCAAVTFPVQDDCPRCAERDMQVVELPREGWLWTWTVQTFPPRAPFVPSSAGFEPFCLGYVDLGEVVVAARLDAVPEDLVIGQKMRLVSATWTGADDARIAGYAFAPLPGGQP
jgi:uncharacterized OB-fold protein